MLIGSSFVCLHVHVVFAARDRKALLAVDWRAQLHRYMAGTLTGLEASAPSVGGTRDHVHLLFGMRASQSLADIVREVKKASGLGIGLSLARDLVELHGGAISAQSGRKCWRGMRLKKTGEVV